MALTLEERVARLDDYVARGAIIRGEWTDGHERACLLAALSPEVANAKSSVACPAELMPTWFAELTVWIDDNGSDEAHSAKIRRYQKIAHGLHKLDAAAWTRLDFRCRRIGVLEARTLVNSEHTQVLAAVDGVVALLDRAIAGDLPTEEEWLANESAAWTARAVVAAWAAAGSSAAWTAWAAAAAAARAAESWAAARAAADRIMVAIFEALEDEILTAERRR